RYLERVYHPDRLRWPMKRVGPKGKGQFVRISWDEAVATVARRFREIAESPDGPPAILPSTCPCTMFHHPPTTPLLPSIHPLPPPCAPTPPHRRPSPHVPPALLPTPPGPPPHPHPATSVRPRHPIHWSTNPSPPTPTPWPSTPQARRKGARIVTIDPYKSR